MRKTILALSMLAISPAQADVGCKDWTQDDTTAQSVFYVLLAADWRQTLNIAARPDKYSEVNPILGRNPSDSKVNTYIAAAAIAHGLIACKLPPKYRAAWQYTWIAVEAGAVSHNARMGLRINW